MFIKRVGVDRIKNSRGEPSIQIIFHTLQGKFSASAPSGKSKGKHETPAYNSKGFNWSVRMLKVFAKKLIHKNFKVRRFDDLKEFENLIRKFESQFGKLGANSTYALETAFLKAAANENKKELWEFVLDSDDKRKKPNIPYPVGNVIGGGLHSKGKKPDFQEFLAIPHEKKFSKSVTKNVYLYESLKHKLKKNEKEWFVKKNDENAWRTSLTNEQVLEIMHQESKGKAKIGLDVASSSFFKNSTYNYKNKELIRDRREQIDYIKRLVEKYDLFYIEDPLDEEDFSGFADLRNEIRKLKKKGVLVVGDDLTVTNIARLKRAIRSKSINAMIVKPNQNGYLLEVRKVVDLCRRNNIKIIFSHRSGETMDDALADYAVGFEADLIKTGVNGKERLIKLRRVMEIERSLR